MATLSDFVAKRVPAVGGQRSSPAYKRGCPILLLLNCDAKITDAADLVLVPDGDPAFHGIGGNDAYAGVLSEGNVGGGL